MGYYICAVYNSEKSVIEKSGKGKGYYFTQQDIPPSTRKEVHTIVMYSPKGIWYRTNIFHYLMRFIVVIFWDFQ